MKKIIPLNGQLVRMRKTVTLANGSLLPKWYVFCAVDVRGKTATLMDTDPGGSVVARRVALSILEPLPPRTALIGEWCDGEAEDDYRGIEQTLQMDLTGRRGVDISFRRQCRPQDALQMPLDVYAIDYGGMGVFGATDTVLSIARAVDKLAEERPSLLVILWTSFTGRFYRDAVENDAGDLLERPNVIYRDGALGCTSLDYQERRKEFQGALDTWFTPAFLDEHWKPVRSTRKKGKRG